MHKFKLPTARCLWYPELNPRAVSLSDKKVSTIDVVCGPTGDFTYACKVDKLSCSTNLQPVFEMCNSNVFHSCKNNSLDIAKHQTLHKSTNLNIDIFAAEGHRAESYTSLIDKIHGEVSNKLGHRSLNVCMAHSAKGLSALLAYVTTNENMCRHGIVILAGIPAKGDYSVLKALA